jgi:hypothetical protein
MDTVELTKGERKRMELQFGFHHIDVVKIRQEGAV